MDRGNRKGHVSSNFLIIMSAWAHYQYTRITRMLLKHKSFPALVESFSGDDAGPKRLTISHLDDVSLHSHQSRGSGSQQDRPTSNAINNSSKPILFNTATTWTGSKAILEEENALFSDRLTDSKWGFVVLLGIPNLHTCAENSFLLLTISRCFCMLFSKDWEKVWKNRFQGRQRQIILNMQLFISNSGLQQQESPVSVRAHD